MNDTTARVAMRLLGYTEEAIKRVFVNLPLDRERRELYLKEALNKTPEIIESLNSLAGMASPASWVWMVWMVSDLEFPKDQQ